MSPILDNIVIYTLELDNSIENRAKTNIAIIIF